MSTKNRDYFFDNYKALLIVLVVVGHFIEPCYDNNVFLSGLKWMIFSFHMPAFIFISGYFSKREIRFGKLVQKLVIPYFVYELIYYFLYVFIIHKETVCTLQDRNSPCVHYGPVFLAAWLPLI